MKTNFLMNSRKSKAAKLMGIKKPSSNVFSKGVNFSHHANGYKKGGRITEIEIVVGMPKGMKKHGMGKCHAPVKKAFGGPMPAENPAVEQRIDGANQLLRGATGLKKGGVARHSHFFGPKSRVRKADGGSVGLTQMANRDLAAGKSALGLKCGGDVKMAAGGVGKIRLNQMSKAGKPIKPSSRNCYKGK